MVSSYYLFAVTAGAEVLMSQGVMYVEILPSTKGIGKAVEKDATAAFKGAEKTGTGFFGKMGKAAKGLAIGIGAAGATVAAIAIKGGISRALNIEDAQAKLKGLGHDTKSVEAIMNDALGAVKGTAFGLDSAATVAASAVAAGIEPGKELESYLRLTADAATIAGISMDEMGSIMNKVQTNGRAMTENLNQLSDRGIPILQWLAEEYGVTTEEMSKMVSQGKVDAETFNKVLQDNIGGAALASGETTRGAFANMMASLSRLGLVFVEDGLGGAKTFFNEVTVILDGLADRLRPWVKRIQESLGEAFEVEGFGERFLTGFDNLVSAIQNGPIPQILSALTPVLPALAEIAQVIGGVLGDAFRELGEALAPVLPELAQTLADAVIELAPSVTELVEALVPLIPSLVDLLAAVAPLATDIVELLIPALEWLVEQVIPLIEQFTLLADFLSGGISLDEFNRASGELGGIIGDLAGLWNQYNEAVIGFFESVKETFVLIYETIVNALTGIRDFFAKTWETIGLVLGGALKFIWGLITGNMDLMSEGVFQGLNAIKSWWDSTWGALASSLSGVWNSIVSAVSNGVESAVSFVATLPGRISAAVSALPGLLVSVGRDMIQGLINGVSSMVQNAVNAVRNVGGAMLDSVKSFLGIKSPSRVFRDEVGKMVGLGLLEGVEDQSVLSRIDSAVTHMVDVPASLAGAGMPERMTLLDADGSILTHARRIANEAIDIFMSQTNGALRRA